jgi:hypothetical protein
MPKGALKCTECDEYQFAFSRWMARFNITGLLALLPLLTLIYAFMAERWEGQLSNIDVGGLTCRSDGITVFATNSGNRLGLIEAVEFEATETARGTLVLASDPADRVFDAGDARLLTFEVDTTTHAGGLVSFPGQQAATCNVEINVRVLNFDQTLDTRSLSCACPSS